MDVVGACRAFVHVGERGSFTLGAAVAGLPQPVVSRRIAALEQRFGGRLFDRWGRRVELTEFGRDLLPVARRLVRLADELEQHAETARLKPMTVAVPVTCPVAGLARLAAAAREHGTVVEFRPAGPAERSEALTGHQVRIALLAVPPDQGGWLVPLGVATAAPDGPGALRIESLRPSRARPDRRCLWVQPEDDLPHVRDRLVEYGHRVALAPAQVAMAESLTAAAAVVLGGDDLLVCSAAQADELGLHWRPVADLVLGRGFIASGGVDAELLDGPLWTETARCLGAPETREGL